MARTTKKETLYQVMGLLDKQFLNFQSHLEKSSNEIRSLEKWLKDRKFCVEHYMRIPSDDVYARIGWDRIDREWCLSCEFLSEDYYEDGSCNGEELEEIFQRDVDRKALIEAPVKTRLACAAYLPDFLKELAQVMPELPMLEDSEEDFTGLL